MLTNSNKISNKLRYVTEIMRVYSLTGVRMALTGNQAHFHLLTMTPGHTGTQVDRERIPIFRDTGSSTEWVWCKRPYA